jgi:putative DNA methylase
MGTRLMAIVAEGERGRVYLSPTPEMEAMALRAKPNDPPETDLPAKALGFRVQEYGMTKWRNLFTPRQLVALTTFSDLVQEARERVERDALTVGLADDGKALASNGTGATSLADGIATYLTLCLSKSADYWSNICIWRSDPKNLGIGHVFARQAIPMTWDYAEGNPFSDSSGSWSVTLDWITRVLSSTGAAFHIGHAVQCDATRGNMSDGKVISTDPPYYDNVPYADLSDFFYVWLRRSLRPVFPDLFATLAAPKAEELVATPYRHGSKEKAETFFLDGMTQAMHRLAERF